jgi:branched-chain amino acid transport system permease protein
MANFVVATTHVWLVAAGFALIYRSSGFFNFAHAGTYTVGAYTAHAFFAFRSATVLWRLLGGLVGVTSAVLVGGLLEFAVFRQMRRRGAESGTLLLASVGCLIVLQSFVSLVFGDAVLPAMPTGASRGVYQIFQSHVTATQLALVTSGLLVGPTLLVFLRQTTHGLTIRASASDPELATAAGVSVNKARLMVFLIGSGLAGLAGVFWSINTALSPTMGFNALRSLSSRVRHPVPEFTVPPRPTPPPHNRG